MMNEETKIKIVIAGFISFFLINMYVIIKQMVTYLSNS